MNKKAKSIPQIMLYTNEKCINSYHLPNKTTLKSLKNAEEGKNITEYASFEDMIKKIIGKSSK